MAAQTSCANEVPAATEAEKGDPPTTSFVYDYYLELWQDHQSGPVPVPPYSSDLDPAWASDHDDSAPSAGDGVDRCPPPPPPRRGRGES